MSFPLPPHWRRVSDDEYVNDVSGERLHQHPYEAYLHLRKQRRDPSPQTYPPLTDADDDVINDEENDDAEVEAMKVDGEGLAEYPVIIAQPSKPVYCEYYSHWSERAAHGAAQIFGLTLRVSSQCPDQLYLKFQGFQGAWAPVTLAGPYGSVSRYDLFIGASVQVYGRCVHIQNMNLAARQWLDAELQRLSQQQALLREKLLSIGVVPCVKGRTPEPIKHIVRGSGDKKEEMNLRKLLKQNARLGEQLASLGLSQLAVSREKL